MKFQSIVEPIGPVTFPAFNPDLRIIMMPFLFGERASLPQMVDEWADMIMALTAPCESLHGRVGYLTIDQKVMDVGDTLRRPGKHTDGNPYINCHGGSSSGHGGWLPSGHGGSHGGYTSPTPSKPKKKQQGNPETYDQGMFMASSLYGCDAWVGEFDGLPGPDGECDHLADQCSDNRKVSLAANTAYWVNPTCVHESVPVPKSGERQWIRITFPSKGAWFKGYTENPVGIQPAGPILPERIYMKEGV